MEKSTPGILCTKILSLHRCDNNFCIPMQDLVNIDQQRDRGHIPPEGASWADMMDEPMLQANDFPGLGDNKTVR